MEGKKQGMSVLVPCYCFWSRYIHTWLILCVYVCVLLPTHIQQLLSEHEHEALQMSKSEEITRRKAEVGMSGTDVKLAFTHCSIDKVI